MLFPTKRMIRSVPEPILEPSVSVSLFWAWRLKSFLVWLILRSTQKVYSGSFGFSKGTNCIFVRFTRVGRWQCWPTCYGSSPRHFGLRNSSISRKFWNVMKKKWLEWNVFECSNQRTMKKPFQQSEAFPASSGKSAPYSTLLGIHRRGSGKLPFCKTSIINTEQKVNFKSSFVVILFILMTHWQRRHE